MLSDDSMEDGERFLGPGLSAVNTQAWSSLEGVSLPIPQSIRQTEGAQPSTGHRAGTPGAPRTSRGSSAVAQLAGP